MKLARDWIAAFERTQPDDWPKHVTETSFSRSSGPGGQHVNRTFSKATVRLPLPSPSLLPLFVVPHLVRHSPHYTPHALLVSSSTQRSQQTNLAECFAKLKAAILDAAKRDLVGETSQAQKDRVKGLVAREKKKVEKVKKMRKDVKSGRGKCFLRQFLAPELSPFRAAPAVN
ncbi:hypothetical protein Rhopal_002271-T1 [Rhodotorula paludigena]|uniref:Prokaryotic-type class I peptide chain release factors domain-containing protein n=1 Tax=Rhodotorula paludigena TaxID=86838 RepID=A0AAV5GII7_9BASI|nr:hypothetical protein Rhopal_002271-T1 [Rhodotorula paludigena]